MLYKVAVVLFFVEALVVRDLGASQIKNVGQNNNLPTSNSEEKLLFNSENGKALMFFLMYSYTLILIKFILFLLSIF